MKQGRHIILPATKKRRTREGPNPEVAMKRFLSSLLLLAFLAVTASAAEKPRSPPAGGHWAAEGHVTLVCAVKAQEIHGEGEDDEGAPVAVDDVEGTLTAGTRVIDFNVSGRRPLGERLLALHGRRCAVVFKSEDLHHEDGKNE